MGRRNLEDTYSGPSPAISVRLALRDRQALRLLQTAWGVSVSEAIRRPIRAAAKSAASRDGVTSENQRETT